MDFINNQKGNKISTLDELCYGQIIFSAGTNIVGIDIKVGLQLLITASLDVRSCFIFYNL